MGILSQVLKGTVAGFTAVGAVIVEGGVETYQQGKEIYSEYQYNTNMDLKGKVLKTTGKAIDAGYKSASQEIKKGYNAIKKDYEETKIKER